MLHGTIFIIISALIFFKAGLIPFILPIAAANLCWNWGWKEISKSMLNSVNQDIGYRPPRKIRIDEDEELKIVASY